MVDFDVCGDLLKFISCQGVLFQNRSSDLLCLRLTSVFQTWAREAMYFKLKSWSGQFKGPTKKNQ